MKKGKQPSYWERWTQKRQSFTNPQTLTSANLYILPASFGWTYGFVLLTLFTGAINYQISMIFLMTFLLAIIGLVSAFEAQNNLKNLTVRFIAIEDTEQGKPVQVLLLLYPHGKLRFALEFHIGNQFKTRVEKLPLQETQVIIPLETTKRGLFPLPRIRISSNFPFGLFRVWGYLTFDAAYYVYPNAMSTHFWPLPWVGSHAKSQTTSGNTDFYDLKQVENPWQQPNRIVWKLAAKDQGWYLKTLLDDVPNYWLFKLEDLPPQDLESKLQQLSFWLQQAELAGYYYGLDLKSSQTTLSKGKTHLQTCLRQLAVY